jgi:hypothetical protein
MIFLSYSGDDGDRVEPVAAALQSKGVERWLDKEEIGPGSSIVGRIDAALSQCTVFAAFISKSYLDKTWTMAEYRAAVHAAMGRRDLVLVAVCLNRESPPPLLADRRRIEFRTTDQVAFELAAIKPRADVPELQATPKPTRSVHWADLEPGVFDTVLNELLSRIQDVRVNAKTPFITFNVPISPNCTIQLNLSRAMVNNRQLEAQARMDRETFADIWKAAEVNRGLLRQNGLAIFTGAFEVDLEKKQRALDELQARLQAWVMGLSPEVRLVDR